MIMEGSEFGLVGMPLKIVCTDVELPTER